MSTGTWKRRGKKPGRRLISKCAAASTCPVDEFFRTLLNPPKRYQGDAVFGSLVSIAFYRGQSVRIKGT